MDNELAGLKDEVRLRLAQPSGINADLAKAHFERRMQTKRAV